MTTVEPDNGGILHYFITALLAAMIAGFGAAVALGLRMPRSDEGP